MEITVKATRIATYGAQKMTEKGYSYEAGTTPGTFLVLKPVGADTDSAINEIDLIFRDFYVVNMTEQPRRCDCPFCRENGICKHIVWLDWQFEQEAELVSRAEKWAQEEADFDPFGKY